MREEDPDILVDLTTARTDFEAEVIRSALEANGIPAKAFTTAGAMLQWEVAVSQPMRIFVRRRDLEAARAALRALRAESVDIDWDQIDTGQPAPDEPARDVHFGRVLFYGFLALVGGLLLLIFLKSLAPENQNDHSSTLSP
jgi:hypothetical protein